MIQLLSQPLITIPGTDCIGPLMPSTVFPFFAPEIEGIDVIYEPEGSIVNETRAFESIQLLDSYKSEDDTQPPIETPSNLVNNVFDHLIKMEREEVSFKEALGIYDTRVDTMLRGVAAFIGQIEEPDNTITSWLKQAFTTFCQSNPEERPEEETIQEGAVMGSVLLGKWKLLKDTGIPVSLLKYVPFRDAVYWAAQFQEARQSINDKSTNNAPLHEAYLQAFEENDAQILKEEALESAEQASKEPFKAYQGELLQKLTKAITTFAEGIERTNGWNTQTAVINYKRLLNAVIQLDLDLEASTGIGSDMAIFDGALKTENRANANTVASYIVRNSLNILTLNTQPLIDDEDYTTAIQVITENLERLKRLYKLIGITLPDDITKLSH